MSLDIVDCCGAGFQPQDIGLYTSIEWTKASPLLDNIDPMSPRPIPSAGVPTREHLLSSHVSGSRYVFMNLAPARRTPLTLALAGREECAPDYSIDRMRYPFHVVEFVAQGLGKVQLGSGDEQPLGPGSLFSYAPNMRCRMITDAGAPLVKFFFGLAGGGAEKLLTESGISIGQVRRVGSLAEVLTLAEDIIHEGQRHGPKAPVICLKLLELLLLKASDESPAPVRSSAARARANFARCRGLIEAHAATLSSLDDIAKRVGLQPESVCRLFRRFQNTSPYQFLLRRKMALAAEYLVESGGLVKEAASRVGFLDPYHFARCFRMVHGVSPSEVRRDHARGRVATDGLL